MATIKQEITVQASAAKIWAAFRDVGAIHERLGVDLENLTEMR